MTTKIFFWNLKRFFKLTRYFGLRLAFYSMIYSRLTGYKDFSKKHEVIKNWLKKKYHFVYDNAHNIDKSKNDSITAKPYLWILWFQGEEQMPDLIKLCYKSVKKHANNFNVTLITKKNLASFIDLPDYIYKKVDSGIITLTHFSDIIRAALLARYGGLWLDSTIFVSQDIPRECGESFFTLKTKTSSNYFVSLCRWHGYLMGGEKHNILYQSLLNMFLAYWKQEDFLINYYLIDYSICVLYEEVKEIKSLIDNLPYFNGNINKLYGSLNHEYSPKPLNDILQQSIFHKLTWKEVYSKEINNLLTNYGHIYQNTEK